MMVQKNYAGGLLLLGLLLAPLSARAWYIRLDALAPAARLYDQGNALGQVIDAKRGVDSHDLAEFKPFGKPYLTLVFTHSNWASKSGDYATDFHAPSNKADAWPFVVRTDAPNREIILQWRSDDADRLRRSRLLDTVTGKTIAVKAGKSYRFTMNAQTSRTFVWKVYP